MTTWEYETREWMFVGADQDDWPHRTRYAELVAAAEAERRRGAGPFGSILTASEVRLEGNEADLLEATYVHWRRTSESELLNEFGAAGFEIVSVVRTEETGFETSGGYYRRRWPVIHVFCYFKRERLPDQPDAPKRQIGFAAPSA